MASLQSVCGRRHRSALAVDVLAFADALFHALAYASSSFPLLPYVQIFSVSFSERPVNAKIRLPMEAFVGRLSAAFRSRHTSADRAAELYRQVVAVCRL